MYVLECVNGKTNEKHTQNTRSNEINTFKTKKWLKKLVQNYQIRKITISKLERNQVIISCESLLIGTFVNLRSTPKPPTYEIHCMYIVQ